MNPSSRRFRLALAGLVVLAAAPVAAAPGDDATSSPAPAGEWRRPAHACGTTQVDKRGSVPQHHHAAGGMRTIYLNKNGGTYQIGGGATNSATNVASRSVSANGQSRTAVIAPLASGFNWATIAACVREHYRPYNVRVVEVEPTSGPYIEAVVGGTGAELGYGNGDLFGIAAADNFCGVTETGIAFNFSETHRDVPRRDDELCATIAHEVGHLLALEHETLATDVMSYVLIAESNTKDFVNQSVPCGVYPNQNQPCSCGGNSTNSAGRLTSFVGLRPTDSVPPTIDLVSPGDDANLPPAFEVVARATDNMGLEGVAVLLNGLEVAADYEADGDEYRINVAGVAEGQYTMTVEARDLGGNVASEQIALTIERSATGESCADSSECRGEICAMDSGGGQFCTEACDTSNDTCPDGFSCQQAGEITVCGPSDDGGCCSTGTRPHASMFFLLAGVGLLLVRRRRRRA